MTETIEITIGGKLTFYNVTNNLFEEETEEQRERLYAAIKAKNWLHLIKEGRKPVKWYEPTAKGTKVKFELITSEKQADQAILELKNYVNEINKKFDCGLELDEGDGER